MQANRILPRRVFLGQLSQSLTALSLAAIPTPIEAQPEISEEQALAHLGAEPVGPPPPPYPDPERTAIIDRWIAQVDETLIALDKLWDFLHEARATAPADLEGQVTCRQIFDTQDAVDRLSMAIECGQPGLNTDQLVQALSNEPICVICIRDEILNSSESPDRIQIEIDWIGEDYPEHAAELQRLLDTRFGEGVQS